MKLRVDRRLMRHAGQPAAAARPRYEARLLTRALGLLDRFTAQEEWTFMDLCAATGLHKSTAFRILATLESAGYVEKSAANGRYRPGRKWARLENVLLAAEPLRWAALAPLQGLAAQTRETAHVGILYHGESVTVQLVDGTHAVRMHSAVGKRAPAHASALGKVLLAWRDEQEIDDFIVRFGTPALTPRTITDPRRLKAHLQIVRERGWAADNEELETGLRCVAVPVAEPAGRPVAAVSISGPASRLSPDRDAELAKVVASTAARIAPIVTRFRATGVRG